MSADTAMVAERPIHLVVVELHHHSELIRNLAQVVVHAPFTLSLVTIPDVFEKTGLSIADNEEWLSVYLKCQDESVAGFLERSAPVFASADLMYFNTARHFWKELADSRFSAPAILRVHNVHCDLAPASHFNRPVVNALSILSHLIRKVWIGGEWRDKKRFLNRINYFMFPNQVITDYVQANSWVEEERILSPVLPFGFLGESGELDDGAEQVSRPVTIAVTGKVTNSKKDFRLVYLALKRCLDRLDLPVRLILLGNAGGKQAAPILADFRSLESDKFILEYSTDYVPAEEFEEKVQRVDFLVAPIKVDTHFRKYHEVYGKSKMSGIENDILLHRKPSLVISGYDVGSPLDRVVEYFEPDPDSLAESLVRWINGQVFEQRKSEFLSMDAYLPEVIAERFYQLCKTITE